MRPVNVVLVTRGSSGDVVPFLAIGAALRARGHCVTLLTHGHYEPAARRVGLELGSWDTPEDFRRFIEDCAMLDNPASVGLCARKHIIPFIEAEYRLIVERARRQSTVIVTRHMGSLAALFAAESLGLPLVSVFTAVAQATCWPLFRQLCEVHLRDDLNRGRRLVGLDDVTSWPTWFALPSLYLGCWPEWFAQRSSTWPADVLSLGFVRSDEAECGPLLDDLERWLDRGPRPILVTGGTARWALVEEFYRTAVAACTIAGHRVVVACPHDDVSIGTADDGVVRYRYLPFGTLASRVSAIIHHGGTSVLVRAMVSDLPQLTMPYGADRPDTADRLVKTGVAMTVPPSFWQPEHVAERLTQLLASERVRNACTRMGRLARAHATGLVPACEAIERLAA